MASSSNIQHSTSIASPDKQIEVTIQLTEEGVPQYSVAYKDDILVAPSELGLSFKNRKTLRQDFSIENTHVRSFDETWKPVWGTTSEIRNHYDELLIVLKERHKPFRSMCIRLRVFNDGIGFRYEIPAHPEMTGDVIIMNELTQFTLTGDHTSWWIPADYDSYEYVYETTRVSNIDASKYKDENKRKDRQIDNFKAVNTPVTMRTDKGIYLSFHEANLTDYAGMTLAARDNLTLESELVPWSDGAKVKTKTPFHSPWRTIQIAKTPGGLAESNLILNLNEPNKLKDTSWIKPLKYTGIWWEMHLGKTKWGMGETDEESFGQTGGKNHGATTENARRYIDFTARAGIEGLLIEGWNTGWEQWGTDTPGFFDFTTPYPDLDLEEVVAYAREKGVQIIGHHETSGQAEHYESRLEPAFQLYNRLGIHYVKTGYAGGIMPKGEYHHGQYMVRHYQKVVETGAQYKIAIDAHEPIKGTGIERTWPNMMTREGVRGMEYNAWSEGSPPEHTTILPFTRGLAGPTDYTPGIFDILFEQYQNQNRVYSTLAHQLALFVIIYSPLQMAADMPENYLQENGGFHPAFRFIRDVGVDWDESHVLNANIGDFVTITRKEKGTGNWFIGSITDENARNLEIELDFLDEARTYKAVIYKDGENTRWDENPLNYEIIEREVDNYTVLNLKLAPGGGQAISLFPKN